MPQSLSLSDAVRLLRPGHFVYVPGASGESGALIAALQGDAEACAEVTFCGVWLPGINRFDYAGLHPQARSAAFFVAPEFRTAFSEDRLAFHPLSYSTIPPWFLQRGVDVAFLHLASPDNAGQCSVGIAADFTETAWAAAKIKVGLINRAMPASRGASLPYADLDYVVEIDAPLLEVAPAKASDPVTIALATEVAKLVRDGDTVQVGIGAAPTAILASLKDRRNLRFHSGMVSEPVGALLEAGAIASDAAALVAGVAFGSHDFYQRIAAEPRMRFAPVTETHAIAAIAAIPNFVAINSVLSVDLFGQCNAEMLGSRQVSGSGGLTDFIRGANASPGGRAIIALPSSAKNASRIVATHPIGTVVSSGRVNAPIIVTEYGAADLRGLSLDRRAEALMAVAAPEFRDGLAEAWRATRATL